LFPEDLLLAGFMRCCNEQWLKGTHHHFSGTPIAFNMIPIGQNLVNPNWKKFKPTNAVKNNQYLLRKSGLESTPSARERSMKKPAIV
jgi:hypothetical protein